MIKRIGYVAISMIVEASTNRTCRLANATTKNLRALIESNLNGLREIVFYNIVNNFLLYRISSEIIPFGSHPINKIKWWEDYKEPLQGVGKMIKKADMRVSMHMPPFVNFSSPFKGIVKNSVRDLIWHSRFLDALGVDNRNKIIVHLGGGYGNKEAAMKRFIAVLNELPSDLKKRLVLENDEKIYTVEDCISVSNRIGLPVIFDYLHHQLNPGSYTDYHKALQDAMNTWQKKDGVPKVHYSDQAKGGRKGAHSDTVDIKKFMEFYRETKDLLFDIMMEVKDKDLSVLKVRNALQLGSL